MVKKSTTRDEGSQIDGENKVEQSLENDKDAENDFPTSHREDKSAEVGLPLDGEMEADVAPLPNEELNESVDISSPSKSAHPRKIGGLSKESEESSDLEGKANAKAGKRTEGEASDEESASVTVKTSKIKTDDAETDSEKQSSQDTRARTADRDRASTKSPEHTRGPVKGKKVSCAG